MPTLPYVLEAIHARSEGKLRSKNQQLSPTSNEDTDCLLSAYACHTPLTLALLRARAQTKLADVLRAIRVAKPAGILERIDGTVELAGIDAGLRLATVHQRDFDVEEVGTTSIERVKHLPQVANFMFEADTEVVDVLNARMTVDGKSAGTRNRGVRPQKVRMVDVKAATIKLGAVLLNIEFSFGSHDIQECPESLLHIVLLNLVGVTRRKKT